MLDHVIEALKHVLKHVHEIVLPNWHGALGVVVAFVAGVTLLRQQRRPGNVFAWIFFILLSPVLGAVLFLTFGGRKHRRIAATKREINKLANVISDDGVPATSNVIGTANAAAKVSAGAPAAVPLAAPAASPAPAPAAHPPPAKVPRPLGGNDVSLLADPEGVATWSAFCEEIENARETIHITTYLLGHGPVGKELIRRLALRAAAGVKVRLLADAIGSSTMRWGFCAPLLKAGGQVRRFMPLFPFGPLGRRTSANLRNHRKIAVFDGARAIIGGQNLSRNYMGPEPDAHRFRDFSVLIKGPAVADLTRIFLSDWCFATGESPENYREQLRYDPPSAGDERVEIVSSGPDVPNDPLWEHFVSLILEARRKITIVTPYLVPDDVIFRVLLARARDGLYVRIFTPAHSDHPFLDLARRPYLRALHAAGAEIMLYTKGVLHGKLFLFDSTTGVVGSANLDMRSLFVNFETAAFIQSPKAMRPFRKLVHEIRRDCVPYAETPLADTTLKNRIFEIASQMIAPLL